MQSDKLPKRIATDLVMMTHYDIPYYLDFLPAQLLARLDAETESTPIEGLKVARGLQQQFPKLESKEALQFVIDIYMAVRAELGNTLAQRMIDRSFVDKFTADCNKKNLNKSYHEGPYETVIGATDENGRVVVGPLPKSREKIASVSVPDFIKGFQVTLFGPPDTAKMSINAMNALHRVPASEPQIVSDLVRAFGDVPRWGADNEDSKTPIMRNFLQACENLIGCFDGSLSFEDPNSRKTYQLEKDKLSLPIKRIPGLALPDGSHLYHGNPLPLHLFDFAMHLFHNWSRPEALMFYVPKLENEEEALYFHNVVATAESAIKKLHPEYELGSVRLFIVFESPRAIFRIQEMANALAPYFLGGSLGWHDFLGSTARLFRLDPNYRIPVKADPNIVINNIRESHHLLVDALRPINGICIGGMYGTLFEDNNPESYQVSIVGYVKDVVTQLKRGLNGFWVAHPAFVRPGMAIVEAYRRYENDNKDQSLQKLVESLVPDDVERESLTKFINAPDIPGLPKNDSLYHRGVLAANIQTSTLIANDDPDEVRFNVFQAIQYLTDWLCGNGCVALPATMTNAKGKKVFVRIMDDLATTERSRWELWAEVFHGRVSKEQFEEILQEELAFIREGKQTDMKRTQVQWTNETARWYPVAESLLRKLVTDSEPVEFATELLMPFTFDMIRDAADPWQAALELCPGKYEALA